MSAAMGIQRELALLAAAFLLGFVLRLCYDPLLIWRRLVRHGSFWRNLEDILFWTMCSVLMFGLLFTKNHGTPRVYVLAASLAGMVLAHWGISPLLVGFFGNLLIAIGRKGKRFWKKTGKRLKNNGLWSKIRKKVELGHSEQREGCDCRDGRKEKQKKEGGRKSRDRGSGSDSDFAGVHRNRQKK